MEFLQIVQRIDKGLCSVQQSQGISRGNQNIFVAKRILQSETQCIRRQVSSIALRAAR